QRLLLGWAQVGEDDATQLLAGVGRMLDPVLECAPGGLGRLLQAVARYVVNPTVERAADAAVLNAAVGERGQSMRASEAEQAHPTVRVTKHDEVFAQEAYGFRLAARLDVDRIAGRDQVAAKPVAATRLQAELVDQH